MSAKAKRVIHIGLDGADPVYMKRLLEQGRLPNFKKLIDMGAVNETNGVLGGMLGALPTITPPCWATLANGAYPGTHGITCFWNHELGKPLNQMDYAFDSRLNKAEYIWDAYAREGKKSIVWHFCCAFPPTPGNDKVIMVDGTHPATPMFTIAADFERVFECSEGDFAVKIIPKTYHADGADCLFSEEVKESQIAEVKGEVKVENAKFRPAKDGVVFTHDDGEESQVSRTYERVISAIKPATGWKNAPAGSKEVVLPVNKGEARRFGLIIAEDGKSYNKIEIYTSKQDDKPIGACRVGEWTDMMRDTFRIDGVDTPVAYRFKLVEMNADGSEMRIYMSPASNLKDFHLFYPEDIGQELYEKVGPPLHLAACSKTDKLLNEVMVECWQDSLKWQVDCMKYLMDNKEWDYLCCHTHQLDSSNHNWTRRATKTHEPDEYKYYRGLLDRIYEATDNFIGEFIKYLDGETVIVVTSDHGAIAGEYDIPLIGDPWGINVGVMQELGYTKIKEIDGKLEIDWENTTAVSQRSGYVYVNLKGRDPQGIVDPKDYEELVGKIIDDLYSYRDPKTGKRIVAFALKKEDMDLVGLGGQHCGDIYFVLEKDFCRIHGDSLPTYIRNESSPMALFIIAGAGVKKGVKFRRKVRQVDVIPTIAYLQGGPMPRDVEGGVVYQALED